MCDSYLGLDESMPLKIKVEEITEEEKVARASKGAKPKLLASDSEPESGAEDEAGTVLDFSSF